jgi:hypothetical protein
LFLQAKLLQGTFAAIVRLIGDVVMLYIFDFYCFSQSAPRGAKKL